MKTVSSRGGHASCPSRWPAHLKNRKLPEALLDSGSGPWARRGLHLGDLLVQVLFWPATRCH